MAKNRHVPFSDAIDHLLSVRWGRPADDSEALAKELVSQGDKLSGLAVIELIRRWDGLMESIAMPVLDRKLSDLSRKIYTRYEEELKWREDAHGPAPDTYKNYLFGELFRAVGRSVYHECRIGLNHWAYRVYPPKDHPDRKDYDRWMRRKAPKSKEANNAK